MKKYSTLIFDLDDTLIDNRIAMKTAFKIILYYLDIGYSDDLFLRWCLADKKYWYNYENGLMEIPEEYLSNFDSKKEYLRTKRFQLFFKGISYDYARFINELYCNSLSLDIVLLDGVRETLEALSHDYKMVVATNGPGKSALDKVSKTNLDKYIEHVYTSEEIGSSKPSREYFDYIFNSLSVSKDEILFIGDAINPDIQSGILNEFDTCWYNPNTNDFDKVYIPTMEIREFKELKKKLNNDN